MNKTTIEFDSLYYIIIIQIFVLFLIEWYSQFLDKHNNTNSKECVDRFNQAFLTIRVCLWNLSHIFVFLFYCFLLKPITLYDHLYIIIIGVIWYLIQSFARKHTSGNINNCQHVVYENMLRPRPDDFIFNTLGQMIYIIIIYFTKL